MEWGVIFGGVSAGIMLVATISGFVYLIMRLTTNPIKEDVDELKKAVTELTRTINSLSTKIKSDADLDNIVQVAIANHERNCLKRKAS
jgi:hypothetical protein